jgi:hypothetical protein
MVLSLGVRISAFGSSDLLAVYMADDKAAVQARPKDESITPHFAILTRRPT